jgi:hypothetical protein
MAKAQAGNSALGWWQRDDTPHVLNPGDVLRARDAEDGDEWAVVKVSALHTVRDIEEAVITPLLTFGPNVSAPVSGEGGILRAYDVLSPTDVAELLPAPEPESTPTAPPKLADLLAGSSPEPAAARTDVEAAKAGIARARVEA